MKKDGFSVIAQEWEAPISALHEASEFDEAIELGRRLCKEYTTAVVRIVDRITGQVYIFTRRTLDAIAPSIETA